MPATVLEGCYVISLRPVGQHGSMRRAAARHGARLLALSSCRLVRRDDAATRSALCAALAAPRVVFTSREAVSAACALQPLHARRGQQWFAVGSGTAAALARAGVDEVAVPARMDSEGLLALDGLRAVDGVSIGVVTAPGGRGTLERALMASGAVVLRADVYQREPIPPAARAITALQAIDRPAWLALSSGQALENLLAALPEQARVKLLRAGVVAASDRLAHLARASGFCQVAVAASARPHALLAAVAAEASASMRAAAAAPS